MVDGAISPVENITEKFYKLQITVNYFDDKLATEVFVRWERLRPRPFGRTKQAHPPPPQPNTEVSPLYNVNI